MVDTNPNVSSVPAGEKKGNWGTEGLRINGAKAMWQAGETDIQKLHERVVRVEREIHVTMFFFYQLVRLY